MNQRRPDQHPLFVFMGYIIERANVIDRLFRASSSPRCRPCLAGSGHGDHMRHLRHRHGIVGAVVTLMGLLAFPAMLRAGYDIKLSAGAITAGGLPGILIPRRSC
jgi:TRAP-type mannitol/chloroaromatic compound transport system permease large subunit